MDPKDSIERNENIGYININYYYVETTTTI